MRVGMFVGGLGTITEAAAVVTATVTVPTVVPFSATLLGDTVHVDCAGAPLQLKAMLWLNPPLGATVIE